VTQYAQFKIFSLLFGAAYVALFFYSERTGYALFRYYPVLGRFYRDSQPIETAGPPILWYSWLAGAAVVSLVASLVVPRRLADRVPHDWIWLVNAAVLLVIIVYERRWFY